MLHENEVLSSEAFINEFSRFPDLQVIMVFPAFSHIGMQWHFEVHLPAYSDRIAQDLHLIPS